MPRDIKKRRENNRRYQARFRKENPEREHANTRRRFLMRAYGLTPGEYDALVVTQNGRCSICGCGDERLCVDHDHVTGIVRGLLCRNCNGGIGLLQDNPDLTEKATTYLRGGA